MASRCIAHDFIGYMILPHIPTIPTHMRRESQGVAANNLEFPLGCARIIGDFYQRDIFAFIIEDSGDTPICRIYA